MQKGTFCFLLTAEVKSRSNFWKTRIKVEPSNLLILRTLTSSYLL